MSIVPVAVALHVFNKGVELTDMDDIPVYGKCYGSDMKNDV